MNEDIVYARNTETRCNNCLDFVLYLLKLYVSFTLNKTENSHKTLGWLKPSVLWPQKGNYHPINSHSLSHVIYSNQYGDTNITCWVVTSSCSLVIARFNLRSCSLISPIFACHSVTLAAPFPSFNVAMSSCKPSCWSLSSASLSSAASLSELAFFNSPSSLRLSSCSERMVSANFSCKETVITTTVQQPALQNSFWFPSSTSFVTDRQAKFETRYCQLAKAHKTQIRCSILTNLPDIISFTTFALFDLKDRYVEQFGIKAMNLCTSANFKSILSERQKSMI